MDICPSTIRREFPFGFIAVAFAILLLGLCVFLPFEIQIGGAVSYISPTGIALIAGCALLGIFASVRALLHPDPYQNLLGIAAAVFSALILTVSVTRVLKHFPSRCDPKLEYSKPAMASPSHRELIDFPDSTPYPPIEAALPGLARHASNVVQKK